MSGASLLKFFNMVCKEYNHSLPFRSCNVKLQLQPGHNLNDISLYLHILTKPKMKRPRSIIVALLALACSAGYAQNPRAEIAQNKLFSGANFYA